MKIFLQRNRLFRLASLAGIAGVLLMSPSSCKTTGSSSSVSSAGSGAQPGRLDLPSEWLQDWPDTPEYTQRWNNWQKNGFPLSGYAVPIDGTGKRNPTARAVWYNTPQGSFIYPLSLFLSLKTADGSDFAGPQNLMKYGFVYPPGYGVEDYKKTTNEFTTFGMPLGFTAEPDQRPDLGGAVSFGVSCAACHTGEVIADTDAGRKRFVVDGGQPMLDFTNFLNDLNAVTQSYVNDANRTKELCNAARGLDPQIVSHLQLKATTVSCEQQLKFTATALSARLERNKLALEDGPGRLDALAQLINELAVSHLKLPKSTAIAARAPVSYPHVWTAPDLECVQTNCLTSDPLSRNLGEVSGVFGIINVGETPTGPLSWVREKTVGRFYPKMETTANPINMFILEDALHTLKAPQYQKIFSVDKDRANQGKQVYFASHTDSDGKAYSCSGCHVLADRNDPKNLADGFTSSDGVKRFYKVERLRPEVLGTDSAFAEQTTAVYLPHTALPGIITAVYISILGDKAVAANQALEAGFRNEDIVKAIEREFPSLDKAFDSVENMQNLATKVNEILSRLGPGKIPDVPAIAAFGIVNAMTIKAWGKKVKATEEQLAMLRHFHASIKPLDIRVYKSRPLDGIAFTGPYLHNGSVPTLADLLKPEAERPKSFAIGTLQYDAQNLGYQTGSGTDVISFRYDTSLKGNYNTGHRWGTELSAEDKKNLLEYLKTL